MKNRFNLIVLALGLWAALGYQNAYAIANFQPPQEELYLLPPYCATLAGPAGVRIMTPEAKKWASILGPEYYDIHHYCDGLWHWNMAQRTFGDPQKRLFYLTRALGGFEYVETRARPDFVLNAEIAYFKGKTLMDMARVREAIIAFQHAIKIQPGYASPYAALADYYVSAGQKADARKILEEGLQQAPNAEMLTRRLTQLK